MSQAQNKRAIELYVEEFVNKDNYNVKGEIFTPDFVDHTPIFGLPGNAIGQEQAMRALRAGFPDNRVTLDEITFIGDEATVVRFTIEGTHRGAFGGTPPTGRHVKYSGLSYGRYAPDGRVRELWTYRDDVGLFQQLGVLAMPAQTDVTQQPSPPAI